MSTMYGARDETEAHRLFTDPLAWAEQAGDSWERRLADGTRFEVRKTGKDYQPVAFLAGPGELVGPACETREQAKERAWACLRAWLLVQQLHEQPGPAAPQTR
jgi:hypothetical protein